MTRYGKKKVNYIIVSVVALILFFCTVAYATLSKQLSVSGAVGKKGGTWNIYMSNAQVYQTIGSGKSENLEIIDNSNLRLAASLTEPGDTVSYTFKINNTGTINAKLDGWGIQNSPEFNSFVNRHNISVTLTYLDGSLLNPYVDILPANTSKTFKLTFKYNGLQPITDEDAFLSVQMYFSYTQETVVSS